MERDLRQNEHFADKKGAGVNFLWFCADVFLGGPLFTSLVAAYSGIARGGGKVGACDPGRKPWERISTIFAVI